MKYIQNLAKLVNDRWRLRHYDSDAFAEIASQALAELPGNSHIDYRQILEWATTTDSLPPQDRPEVKFGEPAIRLFDSVRFYIQALFWFDSTTAIHQHSFSGAFEVLAGSSIHARYRFSSTERYSEHLKLGELDLQTVQLLKRGEIRPILHGDQFIHALFHLDRPSVTLLVRTHNDAECGPLFTYLKPGIAYNTFHVIPQVKMLREVLAAGAKLGDGVLEKLAGEALVRADAEMALHVLRASQELVPLEDWPKLFARLVRLIRPKDKLWMQMLHGAFEEEQRLHAIFDCRRNVQDPELRFFLALLLNVPARKQIFDLIRDRFPRRNPIERIVDWTRQLWNTTMVAENGARVSLLQLECEESVKTPALSILAALLKGKSDKAIVRSMPQYNGVENICRLWREQPLLLPLFH